MGLQGKRLEDRTVNNIVTKVPASEYKNDAQYELAVLTWKRTGIPMLFRSFAKAVFRQQQSLTTNLKSQVFTSSWPLPTRKPTCSTAEST